MLGNRPDQFIQQLEINHLEEMRSWSYIDTCIPFRALFHGTALYEFIDGVAEPHSKLYELYDRVDADNKFFWLPRFVKEVVEEDNTTATQMNVLLLKFHSFYTKNLFFQGTLGSRNSSSRGWIQLIFRYN